MRVSERSAREGKRARLTKAEFFFIIWLTKLIIIPSLMSNWSRGRESGGKGARMSFPFEEFVTSDN